MTHDQVSYRHYCELRVFVNSFDIISIYDPEGNEEGYSIFANQLIE